MADLLTKAEREALILADEGMTAMFGRFGQPAEGDPIALLGKAARTADALVAMLRKHRRVDDEFGRHCRECGASSEDFADPPCLPDCALAALLAAVDGDNQGGG